LTPLGDTAPGRNAGADRLGKRTRTQMKILVVDDCKTEALCLRLVLERMGYEVILADGGEAAWTALQLNDISVVISDWLMPDVDGLELCRRIRAQKGGHYTYVILLTSRDRALDRLEGLRSGADDFLVKPANSDELAVRLDIARRILDTQAELVRQNERLEALATTDDLTGLNNRRRFFEALESQYALASRQRSPLSLVMLDVDHFKSYNDTFGHPAGDEVLIGVAAELRASCRAHDTAARYGGEEFIVLLSASGPVVSRGLAERLREALERRDWPHRPITASFGVATMTTRTRRLEELVEQADQALYHSKHIGRNRVTHATDLAGRPKVRSGPVVGIGRVPDPACFLSGLDPQAVRGTPDEPDPSLVVRDEGELSVEHEAVVEGFSRAINLRDNETFGHSRRVTSLTLKVARLMGFGEDELPHIRRGALLHDIGKMGVPDRILLKPGPLSDEEWVEMRKHPSYALEILEPIAFLRPALEIPYAHHERWDGTGYPRGLKGELIPKAARVFAAVDVFDALTHDRPYRAAWSQERALIYIDGLGGTQLDPEMVAALRSALRPSKQAHLISERFNSLPVSSVDI
jgi:diguanylate cyclase (GGDEF)-like protein/putative nucleotidyltransferase with HDIG domain